MKYDAINLDYYGTLVDWLPVWIDVSREIVNENNLDSDPRTMALLWREEQRLMLDKQQFIPYKENIKIALQRLGQKNGFNLLDYPERLFSRWDKIKPFKEVPNTLQILSDDFRLAICTNSAIDLFAVSAKNLAVTFDHVVISDDTHVNKPYPQIYAIAQQKLEVPSNRILHVASTQMDVRGASNAGFVVCWINRLNETRGDDTPKPTFEISQFDQILSILKT